MSNSRLPRQLRDVKNLQKGLKTKSEGYWAKRGEHMTLELFHDMAKRVPAYRDFLSTNNFNPRQVKNIQDFSGIPLTNKDNYLRKYPREALCWDGRFANQPWAISATSGSSGEPFYFPRTEIQDEYYAITAELYLRDNFKIQDRSTLYIDAFAMGVWIGGVFTYDAIRHVAKKGYSISIVTPGVNIDEVLKCVSRLGSDFDQVIIGCYPPILKDIIDIGIQRGVKWGDYNLGIVFSAEGFSEEFRDYIIRFGKLQNPYTSTLNHYGTVDLGTMSHETATSIMIRRQATKSKRLSRGLFGDVRKQPTFTQYLPEMFYFEEVDGRVVCSSHAGLPLVRYDLKDNGGVISLQGVQEAYRAQGRDLKIELDSAGIGDTLWNLPFVYLYERSDFSLTLVGGTIYAEEVKKALFDRSLQKHITGKFTMEIVTDKHLDNKLLVHVELKASSKASADLGKAIRETIVKVLLKDNSEFANNYKALGKRMSPQVKLWQNNHPLYFSGKGKQKWVAK